MPGSSTAPNRPEACDNASVRVAFRFAESVGVSGSASFAAQWLAYAFPYRRFVPALTGNDARLGADVVRYSFIVADLHHLLLAGLPAHRRRSNPGAARIALDCFVASLLAMTALPTFIICSATSPIEIAS